MRWKIRSFTSAADREFVERLWVTAMPPAWPLRPAGITRLGEGLVAEAGPGPVGLIAVDLAGSIPLILVAPAYQRRGIGTALLAAALDCLRADGATSVTAGSGAASTSGQACPGISLAQSGSSLGTAGRTASQDRKRPLAGQASDNATTRS